MNKFIVAHGKRELLTLLILTVLCGANIIFYFLLLGGTWFLAFLGLTSVLFLVGVYHVVLWGKNFERRYPAKADVREPKNAGLAENEVLYSPSASSRRLDELPPAIRRRMQGSLPLRRNNKDTPNNRPWWE